MLSLAGLAPNLVSPVVHVVSTGGAIAASLEHSVVIGLAPAGIELTGATAAPATSQVIPGVPVPQSGGVEATEDHADGDDHPAVRLFAPGGDAAEVSIGVVAMPKDGDDPVRQAALVKDLGNDFEQALPGAMRALRDVEEMPEAMRRMHDYLTQINPTFSLRGGTREIMRGIIARELGLR